LAVPKKFGGGAKGIPTSGGKVKIGKAIRGGKTCGGGKGRRLVKR